MSAQFATGTLVEYAGIRWRVLGVEAVLLRSDAGEEVSADPLKIRLPEAAATRSARTVVDELRVDLPYAIQWRSNDFNELILSDCSGPMPFTTSVCGVESLYRFSVRRDAIAL